VKFATQDKKRPRTECKHCTRTGRWARAGECGACYHDLHRPSRATRKRCACGARCNLGNETCWGCAHRWAEYGKCSLCPSKTNARSAVHGDGLCSRCRKTFNRPHQGRADLTVHHLKTQ
jgi:hypothetical protein